MSFLSRRWEGEPFDTPGEYLRSKSGHYFEPRLCHVLDWVNQDLTMYRRHGYPWMTFVLGSGCLEAREVSADVNVDALPQLVASLLKARPDLANESPARIGLDFVQSLIDDRLGPAIPAVNGPPPLSVGGSDTVDSDPSSTGDLALAWSAKLALLTALLTRFYHRAKSRQSRALTRLGRDTASLPEASLSWDDIKDELLDPIDQLIDELLVDPGPLTQAKLTGVLVRVVHRLHPGNGDTSLGLQDLQLLTELSWFFLTQSSSVYPGWSDLLLSLSIDPHGPGEMESGHPRPAFNDINDGAEFITKRYEEVTKNSWSTVGGIQSERDRLYTAVAATLRQQAALRSAPGERKSPDKPPPASAFVTTFDLELEMALLKGSDKPFLVALPVNLVFEDTSTETAKPAVAASCWLGCVVRPTADSDLEIVTRPSEWFLLTDGAWLDYENTLGDTPVVVRLSGCPLIRLPCLSNADGGWTEIGRTIVNHLKLGNGLDAGDYELHHAVLLDEYGAMRQAANDFFVVNTGSGNTRYGLPTRITDGASSSFRRFWMVLGVPVGDSTIRYRFTSHMMSPDFSTEERRGAPRRAGLAVNWHIEPPVRDLLYWYGFDVVRGRCQEFTEEIEHYLAHLSGPPSTRKPQWDRSCPI